MSSQPRRLSAALAAAWEAEVNAARTLSALGESLGDPNLRARLLVLAAFCRAHAARLLSRLSTMGRCPLPVPVEYVTLEADVAGMLGREAELARTRAHRYHALASLARAESDMSSAWVCELNRIEEEELSSELGKLSRSPAAASAEVNAPLPDAG
jgi:hypothetical protein